MIGLTSKLSLAALRHVEAFESDDPAFMAERFYAYHTFPVTRAWRARLGSRAETASYIGIARHPILRSEWESVNARSDSWFSWRRRSALQGSAAPCFKLYISPHCNDVPDVFSAAVSVLTQSGAVAFKIGNDVRGLMRSDKMVAYFSDRAAPARAAAELEKLVAGAEVHGVPFSCQLDSVGLLSWAVDPSETSWRKWVAARLAALFVEARERAVAGVSKYALDRLSAEGIDVHSWTPLDAALPLAR